MRDKEIVLSEIEYLLTNGYRSPDAYQIREGLWMAKQYWTKDQWRHWSNMPLEDTFNELYAMGTP